MDPDENSEQEPGLETSTLVNLRPVHESSLSYDQKLLLQTVARLSDDEVFEELDPAFAGTDSLPPTEYIQEVVPGSAPEISPFELALPTGQGAGYVQQADLPAPPAPNLINHSHSEPYKAPPAIVRPKRARPLSIETKIGIGIALLAFPILVFAIFEKARSNSELDEQQQLAAGDYADEAAESTAQVNHRQQPFRMPAAAPLARVVSSSAIGTDDKRASGVSGDLETGWLRPANPNPEPTPKQVEQGKRVMDTADEMQSLGKDGQAAALLSAALGQCPGNVMLRIATVKAYIRLGQQKTALLILHEGMKNARSAADYGLLRAILPQIPSQ